MQASCIGYMRLANTEPICSNKGQAERPKKKCIYALETPLHKPSNKGPIGVAIAE
jgi:hypothetical protein